jgi:hypothetical protein
MVVVQILTTQLLQTIAVICKRGWVEGNEESLHKFRSSIVSSISTILDLDALAHHETASNLWNAKHIAISLLSALVDEFAYTKSTSSRYGLAWEFHHNCLLAFQKEELGQALMLVLNTLRKLLYNNSQTTGVNRLLEGCINTLTDILSWKFEDNSLDDIGNVSFSSTNASTVDSQPPPFWRALLVDSGTTI